jgi:hypothetical protein
VSPIGEEEEEEEEEEAALLKAELPVKLAAADGTIHVYVICGGIRSSKWWRAISQFLCQPVLVRCQYQHLMKKGLCIHCQHFRLAMLFIRPTCCTVQSNARVSIAGSSDWQCCL